MKPNPQKRVTSGDWGGENVRMTVIDSGAQLQFGCAQGSVDEPLVVKDDGSFSWQGTFTAETPGPRNEDNPPRKQPARYHGSLQDKSMTLAVTLSKTNEEAGRFTLELGKPGRVRRCL